jgi:hypothetical protein
MKAAIVRVPKQTPVYGDFAEPALAAGENRIWVKASASTIRRYGPANGGAFGAVPRCFVPAFAGAG